MKKPSLFAILLLFIAGTSCMKDEEIIPEPVTISYDFNTSTQRWTADFADYPQGREEFYELSAGHSALPAPLPATQGSFRISGNNHSDDLFMFIRKKITGLAPGHSYHCKMIIRFASNAPTGGIGVGGAPGESVILKAGFTQMEPVKVLDPLDNYYRMNIDKANQNNSGADMKVIGNIANGMNTSVYTIREKTGEMTARTNDKGELWAVAGTDSGFEATTTLYYTNIMVELTP